MLKVGCLYKINKTALMAYGYNKDNLFYFLIPDDSIFMYIEKIKKEGMYLNIKILFENRIYKAYYHIGNEQCFEKLA